MAKEAEKPAVLIIGGLGMFIPAVAAFINASTPCIQTFLTALNRVHWSMACILYPPEQSSKRSSSDRQSTTSISMAGSGILRSMFAGQVHAS